MKVTETEQKFGVATTMPQAENAPAPTKAVVDEVEPAVSEEDALAESEEVYPTISSPLNYLFFGFIVLVIPSALFVYCGGLQWMRRVLGSGPSKGKYKKVRDQDLEK